MVPGTVSGPTGCQSQVRNVTSGLKNTLEVPGSSGLSLSPSSTSDSSLWVNTYGNAMLGVGSMSIVDRLLPLRSQSTLKLLVPESNDRKRWPGRPLARIVVLNAT